MAAARAVVFINLVLKLFRKTCFVVASMFYILRGSAGCKHMAFSLNLVPRQPTSSVSPSLLMSSSGLLIRLGRHQGLTAYKGL